MFILRSFIYNNHEINYSLIKTKRKTIGLKIVPEKGLFLSVPLRCTDEVIKSVLNKRAEWIIAKLDELEKRYPRHEQRLFINGEKLLLFGEQYKLNVSELIQEDCRGMFKDYEFHVNLNKSIDAKYRKEAIKSTLTKVYRGIAKEILNERTEYFSKILKVRPQRIVIKEQKTRWGSCSSLKNINYNWKIIMAPLNIVDYIVVHELCHLREMNHSKDFWNLVNSVLPDYKERMKWLKINGMTLDMDYIKK